MMLPLEGVRIVAVEQYRAGPFGTMQLADLGTEVVKVENIAEGGDVGRFVRHPQDPLPEGDSLFFQAFNRDKRSIAFDFKQQVGRNVLPNLMRALWPSQSYVASIDWKDLSEAVRIVRRAAGQRNFQAPSHLRILYANPLS